MTDFMKGPFSDEYIDFIIQGRRKGVNPPEGFVPYKMETTFGTLTLPDRKCALCIANWNFFSCTMCCFTQTLEQDARPIVNKMNEELNEVKE